MSKDGLGFENRDGKLIALGFGKNGNLPPGSHDEPENADFAKYIYDPKTEILSVCAYRTGGHCLNVDELRTSGDHTINPSGGAGADALFRKKNISQEDAIQFAQMMDAALTARVSAEHSGAKSFNDIRVENELPLNRNALAGMLKTAAKDVESFSNAPKTGLGAITSFFQNEVDAKEMTYLDVKNSDFEHLEGATCLTSRNEQAQQMYVKAENGNLKMWDHNGDPVRDNKDNTVAAFTDDASGVDLATQAAAKQLGFDQTMAGSIAARSAVSKAHAEWGKNALGSKKNKSELTSEQLNRQMPVQPRSHARSGLSL